MTRNKLNVANHTTLNCKKNVLTKYFRREVVYIL